MRRTALKLRLLAVVAMAMAGLLPPRAATANQLENLSIPEQDCRHIITEAEQEHGIPTQLLSAISLAEAGRWDEGRSAQIAWPWTVYAEGRGRYLPDKAAAIAMVKQLRAKGVRNIDVGCMQINLHYHPDAFASLDEAFDPRHNADYAAQFLADLRDKHRSWTTAVAHYHSATRELNRPYRHRVMRFWHLERQRTNQLRMLEARARFEERRAQRRAAKLEQKIASNTD